MALAAPLEMPPEFAVNSVTFQIGHQQQISPGGKGFLQTIQRSTPMWFAEFRSVPLRDDRYDKVIEFLEKLEGSTESFLAFDPRRVMPRAYQHLPTTSDPWTLAGWPAPRVVGQDVVQGHLSIDRLEANIVITSGDYISFLVGKKWYLFRSIETKVVSGFTDLKVRPRIPVEPNLSSFPALRYRRAVAQMKMLGGYKEEDSVDSKPVISFRATQFLDRT